MLQGLDILFVRVIWQKYLIDINYFVKRVLSDKSVGKNNTMACG